MRFDISHPKAITAGELAAGEAEVNRQVGGNTPVTTHLMEPEAAVKAGALALFGETYGDEVRVLSMGKVDGAAYSTELCGGTHVRRTGDIGQFKILEEGAVAAGVRRIEAVTGEYALARVRQQEQALGEIAATLRSGPEQAAVARAHGAEPAFYLYLFHPQFRQWRADRAQARLEWTGPGDL